MNMILKSACYKTYYVRFTLADAKAVLNIPIYSFRLA